MKKKYFLVFIISLAIVGTLSLPSVVRAQYDLPFGGLVSFYYTCTCSAQLWIWFTPLYLGPLMITGAVNYSPYSTIPYGYFENLSTSGAYDLGSYSPAGATSCWIYAGYFCYTLPAAGIMTKVGANAII